VLVSFGPITVSYAQSVYDPTRIPADYDQVNGYLNQTSNGARPVLIPFSRDGFRYDWAPEKRIRGFDVFSTNPNLNNFQDYFSTNSFYYWLESIFSNRPFGPADTLNKDVMLEKDLSSRLLIPFSAQYMVYDTSVPGYRFGKAFDGDTSMELVKNLPVLKVFRLDSGASHIRPAVKTVAIDSYYDELALIQRLSADELERVSFVLDGKQLDKKYGVMDLNDYSEDIGINSGFEATGDDGLPLGWVRLPGESAITLMRRQQGTLPSNQPAERVDLRAILETDKAVKTGGKQSLRVDNYATEDLALSVIAGSEIAVSPGEIYRMRTSIKYKNSKWTHVAVEGYQTATGKWVTLVRCPGITSGTSGWKNTRCTFHMPAGFSRIRPVLVAGWAEDSGRGPAVSWFDDIKLAKINDDFYAELQSSGAGPTVKYEQVSQEKYRVTVNGASRPFVLVFGEAFDPLWEAKTSDGKTFQPVKLYNVITGFPIDRRGSFQLTVEYASQRWFARGLVVSLATLVACVIYLAADWVRRRRRMLYLTEGNGDGRPREGAV
jgi:hypothetical protein